MADASPTGRHRPRFGQCMPDPEGLRSIRVQGCAARGDSFHNTAYFVDRLSLQRKRSAPVGG